MGKKIQAIITGSTGMVGEGILHECLQHPDVERVLVINRRPCGVSHPKLREIIHADFFDLSSIHDQLAGYNACFFCSGISSVNKSEAEYFNITYTLTLHIAGILSTLNPSMTFCYISGSGTDSSEQGKLMWARVKGKTENDLLKLPFERVYAFRPGYMQPGKGLRNTLSFYKYISWLYPLLRIVFPNFVSTLQELALAMINSSIKGYEMPVLEVKDIVTLAKR